MIKLKLTDNKNKFNAKLILLFVPVAYASYFFHEFGHWILGEMRGNDMDYSLNHAWPKSGRYLNDSDGLYSLIGGPAFTILQALIFYWS